MKIKTKAKSCLEKLQDLINSSQKLTTVNKVANCNNKVDIEKSEPSNQILRQKKVTFSDSGDNFMCKGISKYGYGRCTSK